MTLRSRRTVLHLVILGVSVHSVVAGIVMMSAPEWMLRAVGWEYEGELFWPRQAGLFLSILGIAYGGAIRLLPLVWLVIGSKTAAVVFLMAHVLFLDAPGPVFYLAAGDGLMGLAVAIALWNATRPTAPTAPGDETPVRPDDTR